MAERIERAGTTETARLRDRVAEGVREQGLTRFVRSSVKSAASRLTRAETWQALLRRDRMEPAIAAGAAAGAGAAALTQARMVPNTLVSHDAPPLFRWDNWAVEVGDGTLGRFSLEAPLDPDPLTRHGNATIGFYLPSRAGNGYDWFAKAAERAPSWSGSAINLKSIGRERDLDGLSTQSVAQRTEDLTKFDPQALQEFKDAAILMPYTFPLMELPKGYEDQFRPQTIALSYKRPGELEFRNHGVVLNPYDGRNDKALKFYDTTDSEHCISAFRDPFMWFEDGQYHMLFAARYSKAFYDQLSPELKAKHAADSTRTGEKKIEFDPEVNSTIGYATSTNLKDWELQKPFVLPANSTQFELPAVTKVGDKHVLTLAVSNGSVAINDPAEGLRQFGPRHQYLLAFDTTGGLRTMSTPGAWRGMEQQINKDTYPLNRIYGPSFLPAGDRVIVSGYDEGTHELVGMVEVPTAGFPHNVPNEHSVLWDMPTRQSPAGEH